VKEGRTSEIIDERIRQSGAESVMKRFVLVGILCAHVMVAFRPRMVEAVKMLEGEVRFLKFQTGLCRLLKDGSNVYYKCYDGLFKIYTMYF
jgi:hypothetical protein